MRHRVFVEHHHHGLHQYLDRLIVRHIAKVSQIDDRLLGCLARIGPRPQQRTSRRQVELKSQFIHGMHSLTSLTR